MHGRQFDGGQPEFLTKLIQQSVALLQIIQEYIYDTTQVLDAVDKCIPDYTRRDDVS